MVLKADSGVSCHYIRPTDAAILQQKKPITNGQESDLTPSIATAKGHLDQEQKNLQSTKTPHITTAATKSTQPSNQLTTQQSSVPPDTSTETTVPAPVSLPTAGPAEKTQECYAIINRFDKKSYSDLTCRYPHISSRSNQYILVVYDYDSGGILVEPLKNCQAAEITKAWLNIHTRLERHGNSPKLYILDNEISFKYKTVLQKRHVDFQLVPPYVHRRNAAKQAIHTFKKHFLSVLATADPKFAVAEWDRLLP